MHVLKRFQTSVICSHNFGSIFKQIFTVVLWIWLTTGKRFTGNPQSSQKEWSVRKHPQTKTVQERGTWIPDILLAGSGLKAAHLQNRNRYLSLQREKTGAQREDFKNQPRNCHTFPCRCLGGSASVMLWAA